MNIGKIPENVYKRSVLKQLKSRNLSAGTVGDCAILKSGDGYQAAASVSCMPNSEDYILRAVYTAVNKVAAAGGRDMTLLFTLMLPEDAEEDDLKEIASLAAEAAADARASVGGFETRISPAALRPVMTVTAIGGSAETVKTEKPVDRDLVVTKWIALAGTQAIAHEKEEELKEHFPQHLISDAQEFGRLLSILPEAATALKSGASAMYCVSEGGILAALWELADSLGVGLTVDIKEIPIRQESVEICEVYDINPYALDGCGSLLIVTGDGPALVDRLAEEGIPAVCIGTTNGSNDRVLMNDGERRFLDRPGSDELFKVLK